MKYVVILPLLIFLFYMITFTVHNWSKQSKPAAVGAAILALAAAALSTYYLFFF
jgi:hypothetical protein